MKAAEGVLATMSAAMCFLVYPIFLTFYVTVVCQNDVAFFKNRKVTDRLVDFAALGDRRPCAPAVVPGCDPSGVYPIRGAVGDEIPRGDNDAAWLPSHVRNISGNNRLCCC
jgi:hypothetical protein